ncbi:MAG: ABC transporter permease [Planctomycetota bacterium]
MRAAWRLSTNALGGRRSRTLLLIAAVAMSTALVSSVACALASLTEGMAFRVTSALGRADLRVKHVAEERFDASLLEVVRADPRVLTASPLSQGALPLIVPESGAMASPLAQGIDPATEYELTTPELDAGRAIAGDGEIVLNAASAEVLGVSVGDTLEVARFGDPIELTVVGIEAKRAIELVTKPVVTVSLSALEAATGKTDLSEIKIALADGTDARAVADELAAGMPENVMVQTTERVTSGIATNVRANEFMFLLASILSYIGSAFIVLTGMTTNVVERQRELAILRSIGATRTQIASSQLMVGALLGALGACIGLPLGIALAGTLAIALPDRLPAGLALPPTELSIAFAGAVLAGLFGAAVPAINAARTSPLRSFGMRAQRTSARAIVVVSILGVLGVLSQLVIVGVPDDGQVVFWAYALFGLPAMFTGYFFLAVPVAIGVAMLVAPPLSRILRLPGGTLKNTILATPMRHGFTAGALMVGLAMMVSIWTNGRAVLNDWIASIEFPDAFVNGWDGISAEQRARIDSLDFVTGTVAITLQRVESSAFGVAGIRDFKTTFVAFEPEPFFEMTNLHWVAGDPDVAIPRLKEGGAVLVAQEFLVARDGFGIGDTFTIQRNGEPFDFEIVGAVSSPGLDLVNKYFDIGKEYANQALHSVFGSRDDLARVFGSERINLLQVGLADNVSDADATEQLRAALGTGPFVVGSGREIKQGIIDVGVGSMRVATAIAIAAMFIGCLGVGNIVMAGIDARRFEFGVLRAVGARGTLVGRLILGEVIIIALTACVIGTLMGIQGSWAGIRLHELLAGIRLHLRPPTEMVLLGWGVLTTLTVVIVLPMLIRVSCTKPRELLFSVKG